MRARPDRPIVPDALLLLRRIALGTVRVVRVRCWFAIGDAPSGWRLVRGCPTLRNRSREEPPERPLRLPVDAVVATRGTRLGPPPNRTRVDIIGAYTPYYLNFKNNIEVEVTDGEPQEEEEEGWVEADEQGARVLLNLSRDTAEGVVPRARRAV